MVHLQFQQLSSVSFWVNTIINKGFANILDALVIQNRHDMYLSVFTAETKACQGPVGLSDCDHWPLQPRKWAEVAPVVSAQAEMGGLPSSCPHPSFRTETCFLSLNIFPNWPSPSPSTDCIPSPLLSCPSTIFQLSPLKPRKEVAARKPQFLPQIWHWPNNPDHIFLWHIVFFFALIWPWL